MTTATITLARDNTDLPEYPLPSGTRLEAHSYFKFHYDRWLNSDFFTRATQRNEWAVLAIAHRDKSIKKIQKNTIIEA